MKNEIEEIILSYNNYICKIPLGCQKIVEDLSLNDISSAIENIIFLSEGIEWLNNVKILLEKTGLYVNFDVKEINVYLKEINNGLEIGDYILVSDMIQYELIPYFEKVPEIEMQS